jgi:KUP system potassium uptake protein
MTGAPPHSSSAPVKRPRLGPALMIGALGVVYGDIGTSPLYTISETFFGHYKMPPTAENVLGAVSLVFWSLTMVITVKYVGLIMRADNDGEGGIFALWGLIGQQNRSNGGASVPTWIKTSVAIPILIGACLLYGDGMITPAISVLSAVEGLKVVTPAAERAVMPVTVAILIALFAIQKRGTQSVGFLFGPVMLLWFVTIAGLGVWRVAAHPGVLAALNPVHAVRLLLAHGRQSLFVLGAVVLCVTGGEALYADMGHFGRRVISRTWSILVFPCLCLNYFGQGAVLLSGAPIPGDHVFYAVCPSAVMIPMVILATSATIIASQALISGAYSMTQQAIALGTFPRLRVIHTNPDVPGQIYVPFINFVLLVGTVLLVAGFKSSGALAAAYGIAVTGTMGVTTLAFTVVARYLWGWRLRWLVPLFVVVFGIDVMFFGANLLKLEQGGYVPIALGFAFFAIMDTWRWGRRWLATAYQRKFAKHALTVKAMLEQNRAAGVGSPSVSLVVMASRPILSIDDTVPPVMAVHYRNWKQLPRHIIFFSVLQVGAPFVAEPDRYEVATLDQTGENTVVSIRARYGYMEQPNVREVLVRLKANKLIKIPHDPQKWLVLIGVERFVSRGDTWWERGRIAFFSRLNRLSKPITDYFGLETDSGVAMETINV